MSLSLSEQATLNYYQWDYLGRGYYLYETPVGLEPPYFPFRCHRPAFEQVDDGRVTTIIERISNLIDPHREETEQEQSLIEPDYLEPEKVPRLKGFRLLFSNPYEIKQPNVLAFLNALTFSKHPISFEIVGNLESIYIQMVTSLEDSPMLKVQLKAFFPDLMISEIDIVDFKFNSVSQIAINDFGLNDEFVRPVRTVDNFSIDPLTSIIGSMEQLRNDETSILQILFKGVTAPWSRDIPKAVSDGQGGSFFVDALEMPNCAREKIDQPLFSVLFRVIAQGQTDVRSKYLSTQLSRHITSTSTSGFNKLIPLSNEGYGFNFHFYNLQHRTTNRLGCLLNSRELSTFVHYPNRTVVSTKLGLTGSRTKAPVNLANQGMLLGVNFHNEKETPVAISTENRLSHTHIIGATGVGKSTLLAQMVLQDISNGMGCALFDPHGDIVEDVLLRIPDHRKDDVILIDPFDTEFPIGFNLLEAHTEAGKIVLSSDLVSTFKRYATAWGDNMTSVLQNAINMVLDSTSGATLIELKRFLIEESFRNSFLKTVDDPSLHYYWRHEYPIVKKGIAPLLTRIDTFLRPKIIRYMLAQRSGMDFKACVEENKVLLIKLSQGLVGEENSYLLGSLFLSKFNQVAMSRQILSQKDRKPYFLYLDEFQNFITPSIGRILSGARKYGIGLTLAHQELSQIEDSKLLNSVLSNPYTRICFRLGDNDAKRLATGFSYFEAGDLMSLSRGEAIVRIGNSTNDFNLKTRSLPDTDFIESKNIKQHIVENTRKRYCQPKAKVEALVNAQLPNTNKIESKEKVTGNHLEREKPVTNEVKDYIPKQEMDTLGSDVNGKTTFEEQKDQYLKKEAKREQVRKHQALQDYVKAIAIQRGYKVVIEQIVENKKRIDVCLSRGEFKLAIEISVTNGIDYEVQNLNKCLDSEFDAVVMLCDNATHLNNIKERALETISKKHHRKLHFSSSQNFTYLLDGLTPQEKTIEQRHKGYRVRTNYISKPEQADRQGTLSKLILKKLWKNK